MQPKKIEELVKEPELFKTQLGEIIFQSKVCFVIVNPKPEDTRFVIVDKKNNSIYKKGICQDPAIHYLKEFPLKLQEKTIEEIHSIITDESLQIITKIVSTCPYCLTSNHYDEYGTWLRYCLTCTKLFNKYEINGKNQDTPAELEQLRLLTGIVKNCVVVTQKLPENLQDYIIYDEILDSFHLALENLEHFIREIVNKSDAFKRKNYLERKRKRIKEQMGEK